MSIRIKARSGESVEQMLRRFKKLCEKEGLTKDVKRKMNYEKPSERKRRDARRHEPRPVRTGSDPPVRDRYRTHFVRVEVQ
jgi:small subunit ribosomal protein S21